LTQELNIGSYDKTLLMMLNLVKEIFTQLNRSIKVLETPLLLLKKRT